MIFLNSASSATALVFYLSGVCTHTDAEGKQRKARVRNILKSSEKNTIFNEHPDWYIPKDAKFAQKLLFERKLIFLYFTHNNNKYNNANFVDVVQDFIAYIKGRKKVRVITKYAQHGTLRWLMKIPFILIRI